MVFVCIQDQVAVDLVRTNDKVATQTNFGQGNKFVPGKNASRGFIPGSCCVMEKISYMLVHYLH